MCGAADGSLCDVHGGQVEDLCARYGEGHLRGHYGRGPRGEDELECGARLVCTGWEYGIEICGCGRELQGAVAVPRYRKLASGHRFDKRGGVTLRVDGETARDFGLLVGGVDINGLDLRVPGTERSG